MSAEGCHGLYQQSGRAPLKLLPFLPQDNDSSIFGGAGDGSRSEEAAARACAELEECLSSPFPKFLSFVLDDKILKKFVDTFLR